MRFGIRNRFSTFLGMLTVLIFSAPYARAADHPPISPSVTIRVNSPGVVGLAPLYLALEKGYFKEEGLDVEIADGVAKNGGMEIVAALTNGQLDIATIAPSAGLFDALLRGAKLTGLHVLNTVMPSDLSSGIVVRQDHLNSGRYKSAKDLKGMKIAVGATGSTAQYNVMKAMGQAGLATDDVEFVSMPFAAALAALSDSSIDAAFEVEPFISAAEAHATGRLVIPSSETSPGAPSVLVYGNTDFIVGNKVAAERYVYALLRAQRDYFAAVTSGTGRDELYAALMKYTSLKNIAQIRQLHFPTVDPNGAFDSAAMDDLQKFFVKAGGLQKTLTTDQIIDFHFTAAAVKRLDKAQ